ncbi:MAG TPA: hypothetical protein VHA37_09345 [Candidatus Saccharimonadales bacterium]|nr:hypothetical protein [Candidatus Saccharimonadales bacterium]
MDKIAQKVSIFDAAEVEKKGYGFYLGEHDAPEDREPFDAHILFALRGGLTTSQAARRRGAPKQVIVSRRVGHLYHSFSEPDPEASEPQPYRVSIPGQGSPFSDRVPLTTRMDLLTGAHLDGVESLEAMCAMAVALSVHRHIEGIPATIQDPQTYLERNNNGANNGN